MLIPSWRRGMKKQPVVRQNTHPARAKLRLDRLESREMPAFTASLVADINPGSPQYGPSNLIEFNGLLYFKADDGVHGRELWRSDGTAAGTFMVKDINPGSANGIGANGFTSFDGKLYFSADDGEHGIELWCTDGTEAGTVLVADINPGSASSNPYGLILNDPIPGSGSNRMATINNALYFAADDGVSGRELWRSDGIPGGTTSIVADIRPGSAASLEGAQWMVDIDDIMYFSPDDGIHGREFWRSDGTAAGTWLVKDINPGPNPSVGRISKANGLVLFGADDGVRGSEPWRSDGTAAGTYLLKDIVSGSAGSGMGWVAPVSGPNNTEIGMFKAGSGLWKTDGTAAGTVNVVQLNLINPGLSWVTPLGDSVYYSATGNSGSELYKSSSGAAGAVMLTDNPGSYRGTPNASTPDGIMAVNGRIFFNVYRENSGRELWTSDGTIAGTVLVQDIVPGSTGTAPSAFTSAAGTIFFLADHPVYGVELWRLDEVVPGPTISIDDVSIVEGQVGTTNASFTVSLSAPSTQTITIQFLTADGAATAGADYQSTGGTIFFAPGEVTKTVSVSINGDTLGEANETFFVNLSYPLNATLADNQGVGTILDDEPRISINDVSLTEGNSGTKLFTFTVTLSAAPSENVTLSFRTLNGTATSSGGQADFVSQTDSLTFVPGQPTQMQISIVVKGDTKREGNETFSVELFNLSSNAWLQDNLGLGTILNDD